MHSAPIEQAQVGAPPRAGGFYPDLMSDVDDVIQAELDWSAAIVANDADRIATHQAPEWVIVTKNGVTRGETFLGVIRSGVLRHTRMEPVGDPLVVVYDDTAVLTVRVQSTEIHAGRTIENDEWTTTVFVRRQRRWVAARTQVTTVT